MMIDELSMRGYCWIGSCVTARRPISTSARLTTTAITGRRTKISMARMAYSSVHADDGRGRGGVSGLHREALAQLERTGRGDELADRQALADRNVVADDGPGGDKALAGAQLAVLFSKNEDVLPVGGT